MTYEKMMEALNKNGFSEEDAKQGGISFLGSQRDLVAAATFIENDEVPLAIAAGEFYYNGPGTGGTNNAVVVLTNERILKVDKKWKNADLSAFFIDDVNSSKLNTAFLSSQVVIATTSGTISIMKVKKDTGKKFNNVLNKLLRENKKQKRGGNASTAVLSSMDELKKAKELLDAGIINQKEFDVVKKKLLG